MEAAGTEELQLADWLEETAHTELLRFTTAGSVDDGKSTLIGRLLYDSKGVYEDQLASVRKATRNQTTGGLDLSLLTDGLRAEREQGITIDVAYRYFSTPRRKFIIADTPGHEQYTRNMATGASTADLAIVLIDARYGVLPQSRRHAYLASLLGIPHLAVAVNKMDLVDFRQEVFDANPRDFCRIRATVGRARHPVHSHERAPGRQRGAPQSAHAVVPGPSLLEHLETVPISNDRNLTDMRFPVQYVIRPDLDFRGLAGQLVSGIIRPGDEVTVLPSGRSSRVKQIATWDGELEEAFAPMSVTVCLEDELDVSRGDMLVPAANPPHTARSFEATLVWMSDKPLERHRPYLLKHTTQTVQARVREIRHRVDIQTLEPAPAARLGLNEIGVVTIEAQRPLFFDLYRRNRATGGFIWIDPITNETLGAGMISGGVAAAQQRSAAVTGAERRERNGHAPAVVLTGGDEELARLLERRLFDRGCQVYVVPGEAGEAVVRGLYACGAICIVVHASADTVARLSDVAVRAADSEDPNLAVEDLYQRLTYAARDSAPRNLEGDGI